MLRSICWKLCQYRLHRTSNTYCRAEFIENSLMVDPIKGCSKINLHYPSLQSPLQCTLQCMGHAQVVGSTPLSSVGNRSEIGNRVKRWTYTNWGDIALYPASWETTQTNKPRKQYTKMWGLNISSSLNRKIKHSQWIRAPLGSKSNKRHLTSLELKARVVSLGNRWQVSYRSSDSLDCLPSK